MQIVKVIVGIIISAFVLGHLIVVGLFLCPVPSLLSLVEGKKIEYVTLSGIPDYVEQIFSSDGAHNKSDYLLANSYVPNARLFVNSIGNRVASKILMLRHDKFFDETERHELYLNTLDFGGDMIGISVASNYYFKKPVSDLSFEETLTLSGIYKIFD